MPRTGITDFEGQGLPIATTAEAVWRLVQPALKVDSLPAWVAARVGSADPKLATITAKCPGKLRADTELRAKQSLVVALDAAILCARSVSRDASGNRRPGRVFTANVFTEALALRWSQKYRDVRKATGSGRLRDFRPATVTAIRAALYANRVRAAAIWLVVCRGVPGLYTSELLHRRGRRIKLIKSDMLNTFDKIINADPSYERPRVGVRLRLADDKLPARKIAQSVAGEESFDVMNIWRGTEVALARLEAARVWLNVVRVHDERVALDVRLAAHPWPEIYAAFERRQRAALRHAGLVRPKGLQLPVPKSEREFRVALERHNLAAAYWAYKSHLWAVFLTPKNARLRNEYNALNGDALAIGALDDQVTPRVIARADREGWVEIKSGFYKHVTRRFQHRDVWPSEVTGRDVQTERIGAGMVDKDHEFEVVRSARRRDRWFRVAASVSLTERERRYRALERQSPEVDLDDPTLADYQNLIEYDVSGSQPQIFSVLMGEREIERQLSARPYKEIAVELARTLHGRKRSGFRIPADVLKQPQILENVLKTALMRRKYGSDERQISRDLLRDPAKYGSGLGDARNLTAFFEQASMVKTLLGFLPVCEAVAHAAFERSSTAGVEVVDALDESRFCWNPLRRRKMQIGSGAFKLYCSAPVFEGDGYRVDKRKLARRIAPGLTHMADSFFAALVLGELHKRGVTNVVMIHDAWPVPADAESRLDEAIVAAGEPWLRKLGPIYDVFERYLTTGQYGKLVREWRTRWRQRIADCEADRDTWPRFLVKREGVEIDVR